MVNDEQGSTDGLSLNVLCVEQVGRVDGRVGDLRLNNLVCSRVEVGGGNDLVESTGVLESSSES